MQRSITYQGVKIWNSIPQTFQILPKTFFKMKLKFFCYNLIIQQICNPPLNSNFNFAVTSGCCRICLSCF